MEKRTIKSFKSAKELLDFIGKYSEGQDRDERGRFGSGSGSSESNDNKPNDKPEGNRKGMGDIKIDDKTLADLRAGTSATPFLTPEGEFTPERTALHDEIINKVLEGVEPTGEQPKFYVLGGGSGAGKTSSIESGALPVPKADSSESATINADNIKDELPETVAMQAAGDTTWAAFTHEESSYIASRAQAAALERGIDTVLDVTGDSSEEKLEGKIEPFRNAGYSIIGAYVTIPTETAIERATARAERSGRFVPEGAIRASHEGVSRIFESVQDKFDTMTLVDNTDGARVIATGSGGVLTVTDQAAYDAFLAKGK
jgi:predicted ABC-type ATPase